jgi:hypothetical protein
MTTNRNHDQDDPHEASRNRCELLLEDLWGDADLEAEDPGFRSTGTAFERLRRLSLAELLGGADVGRFSDLYEMELVSKLRAESLRLAFCGEDPALALRDLPAHDARATATIFGDEPVCFDGGGSCRPFVVDTPDTFPHRRYVVSYHLLPPEYVSRAVASERAGAILAWLSEAPHRGPVADGPFRTLRNLLSIVRRARNDTEGGAASRWLEAFPGFLGNYERRLHGYWRMEPAGSYGVQMRFHENLGIMAFCSGGILDLYPLEESSEPYRDADIHTGDLTLPSFEEARDFVRAVVPIMEERGILCDPRVVLLRTWGGAFEPDDPHAETRFLADLRDAGGTPDEVVRPKTADLFPPGEWNGHRVLSGISDAVPDQKTASRMLRRTDSFMVALQRCSELRRRLDDPEVPARRKSDLSCELAEVASWRDEAAAAVLESPSRLLALLASVERERSILHESLRTLYDTLGYEPSVRRHVERALEHLDALREGERTYYG